VNRVQTTEDKRKIKISKWCLWFTMHFTVESILVW